MKQGNKRLLMKVMKFILVCGLLVTLSACSKDCIIPDENSQTGLIVEGSHVQGHGLARDVYRENKNDCFRVTFDKGVTFLPIDFNNYVVMNFPTFVDCNATVVRNVDINPGQKRVTYTVTEQTCEDCESDKQLISNWVLVPKFPINYTVLYVKK